MSWWELRLRWQWDPLRSDPRFQKIVSEPEPSVLAMLRDLTAYLRHSLAGINQTVVTVEAEVEGLAAYLRVQEPRFGTRLRTKIHVGRGAASHRITSFLLQPIVSHCACGVKRFLDIALLEQTFLLRIVRPNSGQEICLQFEPN